MKQTSTAVIDLINAARAAPDAPIAFAECFTFITTTRHGQYTWTNVDYDVRFQRIHLPRQRARSSPASNTRDQLASRSTSSRSPSPRGQRMSSTERHSLSPCGMVRFDGAPVYRDRVFLTGPAGAVVGGVRMFQGRISTVDNVGRTQATLTVASDLVILDYDMPRNLFSPTCLHVLYDAGCGIVRGTFSLDGAAQRGLELEHDQFLRRARWRRSRLACLYFGRQRQRARDGQDRSVSARSTTSCIRCHSRRALATRSTSPSAAITRKRPAPTSSTTSPTSAASLTCRRRKLAY